MKRAKGKLNKAKADLTPLQIAVTGGSEVEWQVPLKFSSVSPIRHLPGSLVTKILCERDIQLRLTRFVQPPVEQLGFCVA